MTKQPYQDIPRVKRMLRSLGYGPQNWAEQPDGVENGLYRTALKQFQQAQALTIDGICGPKTYARLEALLTKPRPDEAELRAAIVNRAHELAAANIRERKGQNRGEPFDTYNRSAGVALGSPYCVSLWHYELGKVFAALGTNPPIRIGASTSMLAANAKQAGRLIEIRDAQAGDLILFKNMFGKYFHTGLIIAIQGGVLTTVEGNTSPAVRIIGEGGGVYMRSRRKPRGMAVDLCRP